MNYLYMYLIGIPLAIIAVVALGTALEKDLEETIPMSIIIGSMWPLFLLFCIGLEIGSLAKKWRTYVNGAGK
jgi:hypothetical protein